ncbi:hypothetical protein Glove_522g84 [Diversispora epigaea]|uniref:Uncharacterized protein n=1 Tax=Diversispora epigaea TaxID=1348612 RepID=A0A397GE95_9GLOM|nr:hypothetical protein Glove_522g84 [Diversispora epigaea]
MLKQEYEISSLLPSLFFTEEYDSNEELEQEEFLQEYNETLDNSSTNNIYSKKENNKTFEKEEIIKHLENTELISYVVIDFVEDSTKLRPLYNLFDTWQVNRDVIKEVDDNLSRLGNLNNQNIQVPCIGQYTCKALQVYLSLYKCAFDITKLQCICCLCYEDIGGHIYRHLGKGKKSNNIIAFPHLKIWIPRVLASLGRIPRLLAYKSLNGKIEFSKTSYSRQQYLKFVKTVPKEVIELTTETPLFGLNQDTNKTLFIFQQVICELLDFRKIDNKLVYKTDFNTETIKYIIFTKLDYGYLGPSPNVVILKPGANPNSDKEILYVAEMYKKDFALKSHFFLDIVAILAR